MEKKLKLDETQENKQKLAEEACKLKYELNELEKRFGKKPPKVSISNNEEKAKNSLNPSPEAGNETTLPVMSPIPDDDVLLPSSEAGEENKDKKREASSNPENTSEEMGVSCGVDEKKEPPKPDVDKERAKPNVVDEGKAESPIPDLDGKKAVSPKPEKKAESPKPEKTAESPKPEEKGESPKPEEKGESPKPEEKGESPKPEEKGESPKPEKTAESPKPEEKGESPILNANEKKAGPPKPEFEDNGEEMEVLLRHSGDEKKQSPENNVGNEKEIEPLKPSVDEKKVETAHKPQKTEEPPKLDVSEKKVTSHNPESDSEEMEVSISFESSNEKPKLDVDGGNEIESPKPNVYVVPKPQKTPDLGEKIPLSNPESDVEEMEVLLHSEKLSGTCEKIVESPKLNVYGEIESIKPNVEEEKVESPTKKAESPKPEEKVKSPRPDVGEKKGESPKHEEMEILPSSVSSDEELPTLDVHAKKTVESPNPNVDDKKLGSPVDKKNLESWMWTPKPIVDVETSKPLVDEENMESEVASSNLEKMEVPPSIEVKIPSPSHKRSEKMEILANSESSDTKAVPSDETSPNPQSGIETTVASGKKKVASEHRLPAVDQKKFRSVYENEKKLKKLNKLLEKYEVTLTDDGECDASLRPLLNVSNRKAVVKITPDENELRNSILPSQDRINAVKTKVEEYKEKFRELCPNGNKLEIECKLGTVTVGLRLKNAKLNPEVWQLLDSEIEVQKQLRSEIMK